MFDPDSAMKHRIIALANWVNFSHTGINFTSGRASL